MDASRIIIVDDGTGISRTMLDLLACRSEFIADIIHIRGDHADARFMHPSIIKKKLNPRSMDNIKDQPFYKNNIRKRNRKR